MFSIADNLENVRSQIQKATISAERPEGSVLLLSVSKKHDEKAVHKAYKLGCKCFGENYVSEAIEKQAELAKLAPSAAQDIEWHFIGPVQSNKTRLIAENFAWVQSVDRVKIATRLNDQRPGVLDPLNVCIQVNIDNEDTKSGLGIEQVDALAAEIAALPNLSLRGLMAIPSAHSDEQALAQSMAKLNQTYEALRQRYPSVDTLSMGMSGDMDIAIAYGSTMVRVGTAIFGARARTS